jgi:hypothetical protein
MLQLIAEGETDVTVLASEAQGILHKKEVQRVTREIAEGAGCG